MRVMNILFITSTRLGDAILSTGLLQHLFETQPEAKVVVACGPLPQSIFEGFPNVVRIIPMKKEKNHGHWVKLVKETYGIKWDQIIDLRNSAVSRLLRGKQKFIFGGYIDKTAHKVEQNAAVMKLATPPAPTLHFTATQEAFADALMPRDKTIIGVGPSANWIGKTWPANRFIEVIQWLIGEDGPFSGASVAVYAAPGEEDQAKPVLDSVPKMQQIDGIAKGSPGEVAAALSRCQFYIGNDSGLMHAAAAARVPTVGLFGPSYPHLYRPWGKHCIYAQTPETFDELIDFEGYNPKTLDRTLMNSLKTELAIDIINKFLGDLNDRSNRTDATLTNKENH